MEQFNRGWQTRFKLAGTDYCCLHSSSLFAVAHWATSWQNQQNECAPSEDKMIAWASAQSDQSLRCVLNG